MSFNKEQAKQKAKAWLETAWRTTRAAATGKSKVEILVLDATAPEVNWGPHGQQLAGNLETGGSWGGPLPWASRRPQRRHQRPERRHGSRSAARLATEPPPPPPAPARLPPLAAHRAAAAAALPAARQSTAAGRPPLCRRRLPAARLPAAAVPPTAAAAAACLPCKAEISEACFDAEKFAKVWGTILRRYDSPPAEWRGVYKVGLGAEGGAWGG